jgi:hypothetical protein
VKSASTGTGSTGTGSTGTGSTGTGSTGTGSTGTGSTGTGSTGTGSTSTTVSFNGALLDTDDPTTNNEPCSGHELGADGDYTGESVTVKDGAGNVIGTTTLGPETLAADGLTCTFPISVTLPETAEYEFIFGDGSEVTQSLEQMQAFNWSRTFLGS